MTYRCYCCGARFAAPRPRLPRHGPRYSPEYGDCAVMVCPACGEESFGPARGGMRHGLV